MDKYQLPWRRCGDEDDFDACFDRNEWDSYSTTAMLHTDGGVVAHFYGSLGRSECFQRMARTIESVNFCAGYTLPTGEDAPTLEGVLETLEDVVTDAEADARNRRKGPCQWESVTNAHRILAAFTKTEPEEQENE